jgi:hypothetical protein
MAISYPLSLPTTIGIANIELTATNAVAISRSQFTFAQQVHIYPGQMWSASVSLPPLRREFIEPWVSMLLALRGQAGTFLLGDPNCKAPRGLIRNASTWFLSGGTWNDLGVWDDDLPFDYDPSGDVFANPFVDGNQASGTSSLNIKGVAVNTAGVFLAGDYIQLGSAITSTLHKILVDADSNSEGKVTLEIWPSLRQEALDNAVVTYRNTVGLFRLATNQQSWSINESSAYGLSFEAMEVV